MLYVLALCTPAFYTSDYYGIFVLALGWLGIPDPWMGLPWLANIIYFLNLILRKARLKVKMMLSILTLICSSLVLGLSHIPQLDGYGDPVTVGFGALFWFLSFAILLAGQWLQWKGARSAI